MRIFIEFAFFDIIGGYKTQNVKSVGFTADEPCELFRRGERIGHLHMGKKNIIIGQSGGPTSAINATLAGVVRQAMRSEEIGEVYGILHGIEGLLQHRIIDFRASMKSSQDFLRLAATPSAALGSCRYKLPAFPHKAYDDILDIFVKYEIDTFFYLGGNDSMDTVKTLSEFFKSKGKDIKCIGIPKTIDNDLPCTDHTPGFGSAAKYVATSIGEIDRDGRSYDKFTVVLVEIMGRNAGWLTASSILARDIPGCDAPHFIYVPEVAFDPQDFLHKVNEFSKRETQLVVAVSEGIKLANGEYICVAGAGKDSFGHVQLSGAGKYLEELIKDHYGHKVRTIEMSLLQRSAAHCASKTDIDESLRIGEEGVKAALEGETGIMMAFERVSQDPYLVDIRKIPIEKCANVEKMVPLEWIIDGCNISDEILPYLRPLIMGTADYFEKDGLPNFFSLNRDLVVK